MRNKLHSANLSVEGLLVKDFKVILRIYNYKSTEFGSLNNCFPHEIKSQPATPGSWPAFLHPCPLDNATQSHFSI